MRTADGGTETVRTVVKSEQKQETELNNNYTKR